MTQAQFIAAVEAKPQFIKWAQAPALAETIGTIEKWHGIAYVTTPDGTNTYNVWFMVDKETGNATWQQADTMEPEKNTVDAKYAALKAYLKSNFNAYFIIRADMDNNWAEAEVFTLSTGKLAKKTIIVYKQGSNPIAHLDVL